MATTAPSLSSLDGSFPSASGLDSPLTPGVDSDILPSSKRSTALTQKLTSVLSTSYADHEIRDTLRLLDARAIHNDENTRRNLKANAQREVIDCNARIVDDFGAVAAQLKRVGDMLSTLNSTCASVNGHILAAKREVAPVLEEAGTLMKRKQEGEMKEQLLKAFTAHFLVSDEEVQYLTSGAEGIDERFFTALARVKGIHKDCELLLGYTSATEGDEEGSSRLGLEVLESTTRTLDAAFKKLYNWIQSRFKSLDIEDPQISGSIRRALRVLSERPTLFQNCLDFFAESRQKTLSEAFQDALSGAGGGGGIGAKAIEFSTHEPLRYVGDMLAWMHSAAVSEKEALEGLFIGDEEEISRGLQEGRVSEPWARISGRGGRTVPDPEQEDDEQEQIFDGRKALSELISRNLSLVCQTLQTRIDVTVRSSGDPVLTFKVFNLLDFYRSIFAKLLGEKSTLAELVHQLQSSTLSQFEKAMDEETSAAVASFDPEPATDLAPPASLATALSQFNEICRARGPQMTEAELERLFGAILSGTITACAATATRVPDMRRGSIYKINYMTALKATLANISAQVPAAQTPLQRAAEEIQSLRDQLVEFVTTTFLEYSGVADLTQEIDTRRSHQAIERRKWLLDNLDEAAQRLDEFLSSALMDAQEALKPLLDRTLAQDVVAEAVEKFCGEFDELEGLLETLDVETTDAEADSREEEIPDREDINGPPESLRELYPRTGAEVRALLS
ncbi:Golgi transport complex subunit 6 [Cladophialophora chaetospira]|uniref:Conserved oligomeric Golgi complex subunit 6 n=1 Tax=Cladophialophora chaetospira TaxID=386627 RepID=A0AA38WYR8_9EURO|nr:Golgi transport complex subunit 6 [Cladophialophora chaetospira]